MADVLIIGGGVIGLSIARELRRRGTDKITVIERGRCGREASWAAGGMLTTDVHAAVKDDAYLLGTKSRGMYPALADELLDETGIDIELDQTGTVDVAFGDEDGQRLLEKSRQQASIGIAIETLSLEEILKLEPELSSAIQVGAYYANDWQVENRKLLLALLRYASLNDIEVREGTEASAIIVENGRATGVQAVDGPQYAGHTILATGAWTSLIKLGDAAMPFTVKPIRGQIVEFQGSPNEIVHVVWAGHTYIVPRADGRVLVGSTSEDVGFDHSITEQARCELVEKAARIAPSIGSMQVTDHWSGLRPFAGDSLPVIGGIAGIDDLLIATAHYRNGILLAPVTASLVADAIAGESTSEFDTFRPDRFAAAAAH
ncbi:MAG: glycine oxidase ThiO [Chloracidobacterium sp.]|nr:glycine oxidase ThiO [Chloracidobacterium sp.]